MCCFMVQCLPSHGDTRTVVSFEWRHVSHLSLQGKKLGLFLGLCWTYLCRTVGLYICARFFLFCQPRWWFWGEDLFINYVGMKKMEIFFLKALWGRKCSPTRFSCPSFSWAGLRVFLPFFAHSTSLSLAVLYFHPETVRCLPYSSSLRSKSSSSLQIIRNLVSIPCTKPLNTAGEWQLDGGK